MLKSNFLKKLGLCVLSAALCTAAFASCGKDGGDGNGDDGKKIDENTNISAVESEKIADETAWKAAFDLTKFTNFSMKTEEKQTRDSKTSLDVLVYKYMGDKAYISDYTKNEKGETDLNEMYLAKTNDVWNAYGIAYKNDEKTHEGAYELGNSGQYNYMMTGEMGTMALSQLGSISFSDVSYSEEKKGYTYSMNGMEFVMKFADGLFAGYAASGKSGVSEEEVLLEMSAVYYNIGTTAITLPAGMSTGGNQGGHGEQGGQGEQPGDKVTLTKETDFEALVSEKVGGGEWAKAFAKDSFTNCTVNNVDIDENRKMTTDVSVLYDGKYVQTIQAYTEEDENGNKTSEEESSYLETVAKGEYIYYYENSNGWAAVKYAKIPWGCDYTMICADFGAFFGKFAYSEEKGAYVFDAKGGEGVSTNDIFMNGTRTYVYAEVKFVNGALAYVKCTDNYGANFAATFYDFGSTSVKLPDGAKEAGKNPVDPNAPKIKLTEETDYAALKSEEVSEQGWTKAFSASSYKNFTAKISLTHKEYSGEKVYFQKLGAQGAFVYLAGGSEYDMYVYDKDGKGNYAGMTADGSYSSDLPESMMVDGKPMFMQYICFCPDFSALYEKFTYDDKNGVYVFNSTGESDVLETSGKEYYVLGGASKYTAVEVKIVNGLIAYVKATDTSKNVYETKFYDFDSTEVQLPQK